LASGFDHKSLTRIDGRKEGRKDGAKPASIPIVPGQHEEGLSTGVTHLVPT